MRPPWVLFLVAVGLAAAVSGCSSGRSTNPTTSAPSSSVPGSPTSSAASDGFPVGSSSHTITVGTTRRTFLLYRPSSLPPSAKVPLVIMIHGGGGSAASAEKFYGWDAEADAGHFVVAFPQGLDAGWDVGGGCCGTSGSKGVDDVAFIEQLVAGVRRSLPVDPDRVYATGISEGGMLSYRLACQTHLFAAIGPDSATLLGSCPSPGPVSVIHVHGTADTRIRYDGAPGSGVNHVDGPSVPALNAQWRTVDQCGAVSVARAGVVTTSVADCPAGRAVELIAITGAGHQWPGSICKAKCERDITDPPSTALDATSTIWTFFAAHPR